MVYGLSFSVSWICLLFGSSACFPVPKDYRYPYTATWGSDGGSTPESNLQSEDLRPPLVNLQYGPFATYQQPEADPQRASFPTGNQSPSGLGTPSVAAGLSPSYEPNSFIVSYDSSSNKPSSTLSQGAGYFSPTARPLPPTGTRKETPSFSVQSHSVAGSSENGNMDSSGSASEPVYKASPTYTAAGVMVNTLDFGDGPVPYVGAPATNTYEAGSRPFAVKRPATQGALQRSLNTAATGWLDDKSVPYGDATTSFRFGAKTYAPATYNLDGSASQGAGYVSPTARPLPHTSTPSLSLQSQSVAGTSGTSNMGPSGAASNAGNKVTTLDFGGGPVSYISSPATYTHNAGLYPYASKHTATQGGQAGINTAAPGKLYDGPIFYSYPSAVTPATYHSGDGPASQGVGSIGPSSHSLPHTGKKTPSFSVQSQSVAGTSRNSKMGFGGVALGPVYWASPAYPSAGNVTTTLDFGDGPVPYISAPVTYPYNAGSYPYANKHPATQGGQTSRNTAANGGLDGPVPYGSAPTNFGFGVAPFPSAAPASSSYVDRAGSAPGLSWASQPERETDSLFPDFSAFESLPPSSSRNGYQRALEALSQSTHSVYYEPPVFAFKAVKTPPKTLRE
ncbi:nuclear pore complex protein DDB_G0274915 [Etheostoma spectabile]|uniref:nuclear pore complex protein DDB_G0274915 n=1 Tax=Etheostoma spectabile TaxID=54343 RepID=UPI0013AFA841|nr:nuclear pore complex protein DDB_G0274915-like [Etheostoma spectabile]